MNKKCNEINKEKYLNALVTKQNRSGVNRHSHGINNTMYTHEQVRETFDIFIPNVKFLRLVFPPPHWIVKYCKYILFLYTDSLACEM